MTFENAYNWLLSLSSMPRKEYMDDPRKCGWYLKRLQFFLDILENPEKKIPHYIHVTGTSGKGSTVSFLHSILNVSGKKVASTYSPHPTTILERWKVGNAYMTKREFVELIEFIKPKLDEYIRTTPYDMLSFFELTEAIGFVYFVRKKVEWCVLEVACGGRYDASNIIPYKDIAVITNIGLDHVGIIGNNKEEIAHEKAGIIKTGCEVFTSEKNKKILEVIESECKKKKVKLHTHKSLPRQEFNLKALGKHQIKNAELCFNIAKYLNIPENKIKIGLRNAHQPLRMEVVSKNPTIILDGAHNHDKIKSTVETVTQIFRPDKNNLHLILGFSADKNISKMLKSLSTLKPKTIAVTKNTTNPFRKVADPQMISKQLKKLLPKTKIEIFLDPKDALEWSKKQSKKEDIILSTGSIFVSGELHLSKI
ncbi:hypothetical protein HOF40_03080 [Candidatus Parcubacteria bacterium]|jgi:dihydrofolate synthase / folylpolyglutamate synthase|nr:hypothetical protein [Candidatus Parcubacteria bacterium]MBT3949046.1 hypothetical protein [Candidatus Parcubacteria bacterium]